MLIKKIYQKIIPDDIRFLVTLYRRGITPILVYQMGKVGSKSVYNSLKQAGLEFVFHNHRLNPDNIEAVRNEYIENGRIPPSSRKGEKIYKTVVKGYRRAKIITLVREPISRNISAFFQNFARFTGVDFRDSHLTVGELVDIFIKEYKHDVPLTWFDVEMRQTVGIDVYDYPFPKQKGYLNIKRRNFDLLILKVECNDRLKEKAIADFLDLSDFRLIHSNVGQEKEYAQTYHRFKQTIRIPKDYVEIMCNADYTQHFYSKAETDAVRKEWVEKGRCKSLPPEIRHELIDAAGRTFAFR